MIAQGNRKGMYARTHTCNVCEREREKEFVRERERREGERDTERREWMKAFDAGEYICIYVHIHTHF